jgi:hypothetical protein
VHQELRETSFGHPGTLGSWLSFHAAKRFQSLNNETAAHSPKLVRFLRMFCSCGCVETFVRESKV